ncbi:MAG TPA: hypothetical protein VKX45_17665 [Bryobacteraceae bacterium]|nr:hypothetical protein [Bryobacteraceae bacterium]
MRLLAAILALASCRPAPAQAAPPQNDEPITVSTEHPRLLLRPQRLRLLRRERERASARWQQFAALVEGKAPFEERGFALALYYQVAGDEAAGREAVQFALGPSVDLRQQALVYDWCRNLFDETRRTALAAKLERAIAVAPKDETVETARSRALAAIALFDEVEQTPQRELERLVRQWWTGRIIPALKAGRPAISRDDAYPLFEFLHAMRDNTILDLREQAPQFFKEYPIEHLMSYYPAVYEESEAAYYIGASSRGRPDPRSAALSRAGELAMVAYDTNAAPSQVLQGWLMHDKFILRSTFGAPYEFLWANPYLPGLSYYHVPLVYHNPDFGRLFIRSSWEDDASWFGAFNGRMQFFADGRLQTPPPGPLDLTQAVVCFGQSASRFTVKLGEDAESVFIVGLKPRQTYEVEIDDEEMFEAEADPGGIVELEPPRGKPVGIRLKPAGTHP